MAISKDRSFVVTGEVGSNPKVIVWDAANPSNIRAQFTIGRGRRGVSAAGISSDGRYVAVADLHNDHYIGIYDASSGAKVGEDKSGGDKIMDLCWSPTESKFAVVGGRFTFFWNADGTNQKGVYGGKGPMVKQSVAAYLSTGDAITGGFNGMIY